MQDYREVFSKHGYSLFEPESIEKAIVDAIKERNIRYLYGIPMLLENSKINYYYLCKLAKKEKVWKDLRGILFIASKIIKNKEIAKTLKRLSSPLKKTSFGIDEFEKAYSDYGLIEDHLGFPAELNYHLSYIFAKKQIRILYKIRERERLSKTEKEYFSRTIKKRLIAIRELAPFVKEIMPKG